VLSAQETTWSSVAVLKFRTSILDFLPFSVFIILWNQSFYGTIPLTLLALNNLAGGGVVFPCVPPLLKLSRPLAVGG